MDIDISKFAKLLHEYVDTYVKYKDADNTEKIRLWLLLSDEAKELFLYFSKLQKDNDALKRRIETLQIYADDYWERLKAHRKITRSLNARIDELEGAIEILEDQQRETKNILIDKKLHIDSLYEEGYKMQQRIAELEAENIRLGIEYQRMRLALGDIAINSKRALNESPTDQLTARWRQERQDDKWIPEVQE